VAEAHGSGIAWLAAAGDDEATEKLLRNWGEAFAEAQWPEYWEVRSLLERDRVLAVLRHVLAHPSAGVVRQILALLLDDPLARALHSEIEGLAADHASAVVRWKARRVIRALTHDDPEMANLREQRWIRLDAGVLTGAVSPLHIRATPRPASPAAATSGIVAPKRPGAGCQLQLDGLTSAQRRATCQELLRGALARALDRRLPTGLAYEELPDVRMLREPAPPSNAADERMAELAKTLMDAWSDSQDQLLLNEDGLAMVAASVASEGQGFDEDDLFACGAFVGEVLRRQFGGAWTGFDETYLLEMRGITIDPLGWVRAANQFRDPLEATQQILQAYEIARQELGGSRTRRPYHEPGEALEQTIQRMSLVAVDVPLAELLPLARSLSFQLQPTDWPGVLMALDPLLDTASGARLVAAIALYAPAESFARAWSRWRKRGQRVKLPELLVAAMEAAADADDLLAMPNWTLHPLQPRLSFLNPLRKRMKPAQWQRVLPVLLRQRALAGDRPGVAWCLYSYGFEHADPLELVQLFCAMPVSARQTVIRATQQCRQRERSLFRPLWAEALRDPADPVVLAGLEAVGIHAARAVRHLAQELVEDSRERVASAARRLLELWAG